MSVESYSWLLLFSFTSLWWSLCHSLNQSYSKLKTCSVLSASWTSAFPMLLSSHWPVIIWTQVNDSVCLQLNVPLLSKVKIFRVCISGSLCFVMVKWAKSLPQFFFFYMLWLTVLIWYICSWRFKRLWKAAIQLYARDYIRYKNFAFFSSN